MNDKNKTQTVKSNKTDSVKSILKKTTKILPVVGIALGGTLGSYTDANAGGVNQGATNKATYADADTITFTAVTAITILTASDKMAKATNTGNSNLVWSYAGGNDLTITAAMTVTEGESIQTNLAGAATKLILGEAAINTDAIDSSITFGLAAGTILSISGADTQVFDVDGSAAFAGELSVDNTATFTKAIAATNGLAEISVIASKTATFNEAIKATAINSIGGLTVLKGVTATTITATAAVNINNTANTTIAGNFVEAATGNITVLTIANSANSQAPSVSTLTGNVTLDTITVGSSTIGGSSKMSGTVTAATAINVISGNHTSEDSKLEFTGDVTAAKIVMANATSGANTSVVTSGSTAQTITGIVDGAATLTLGNSGGTTLASAIGGTTQLTEIDVVAAKLATFNSTVDAVTLDVNGTATLKAGANTIGELELAGTLLIDKSVAAGSTLYTGDTQSAAGIASTGKIYIPANLTSGTTYTIADSDVHNDFAAAVDVVLQDTALTDYSTDLGQGAAVIITANDKSNTEIAASLGITKDEAKTVLAARNAIGLGGNSDTLTDLFTNSLNGLNSGTTADITSFAKQAGPQSDLSQGSIASTRAMTGSVQSVISNRMASLRSGDAFVSGMTAGDMVSANSAFMQAIGTVTEQGNTKSGSNTLFGYDSETVGVAVGFDVINNNGSVFGLSVSAAETEMDGLGDGKAKNDIESYTASVYMDKTGENGFIEGSITVGYNSHDASRKLATGGVSRTYKTSYDSEQASLRVKGGAPKEFGSSSFLTPFASFTATVIDTDSHTESSDAANDDLRLKQEQDQINSVVGSVGLKVHSVTDFGVPMISFALNNEFGDTSISTTNTYTGGGSAFKTKTEIEALSATLGLGYTFGSDGATLNIGYEAEANDDEYLSHFGTIKLVGKF
jgi:hypothetical protein